MFKGQAPHVTNNSYDFNYDIIKKILELKFLIICLGFTSLTFQTEPLIPAFLTLP